MLVLSRGPGEGLLIGASVLLKVVSVNGQSVRLGFTAPKAIRIVREEIAGDIPIGLSPDLDPSERTAVARLISYVLTCRRENCDAWMDGLADAINETAAAMGDADRCEYRSGPTHGQIVVIGEAV